MLRERWSALAVGALLSAGLGIWFSACTLGDRKQSTVPEIVLTKTASAHAVGSDTCGQCHDDPPAFYKKSYHRIAFFEKGFASGCESCHGLGSTHTEYFEKRDKYESDKEHGFDLVGVKDMEALTASERSGMCLQCHQSDFPLWPTTDHAMQQVSCWDCHSNDLHDPPPGVAGYKPAVLDAKRDDRFCLQCHEDVRSDFRLQFHHPVPEGQMRCRDCHSIHGEPRENPALQETNERCLGCHAEIRGPWVFEHVAMDEGCESCHQPHGSVNNKLLKSVDNSLCITCHFQQPAGFFGTQPHTQFLAGGALCYDCHFEVHGSNTDRNLNPRRY